MSYYQQMEACKKDEDLNQKDNTNDNVITFDTQEEADAWLASRNLQRNLNSNL